MSTTNRRRTVLRAILLVLGLLTLGVLSTSAGISIFFFPTGIPDNLPGPKGTAVMAELQTREAAAETPLPEGGLKPVGEIPTRIPAQLAGPRGTPAGAGVLTDQVGDPIEFYTGEFIPLGYAWYQRIGREFILVYAGEDANDEQQGVVIVLRSGTIWHPIGSRHESPLRSGGLLITDAQGSRLILNSTSGETFYFDVQADRFVDSLSAIVPTMTPGPTITSVPTSSHLINDDAPDYPGQVFQEQPLNTDLPFYIDPQGDEDWFLFQIGTPGDLNFTLTKLPQPYGFEVYRVQDLERVGADTENSTDDKHITLKEASAGGYLVRVWGIQNAWDNEHPYVLSAQSKLHGFVILGSESVSIGENTFIRSGDLGVAGIDNSPNLSGNTEITLGNRVELTDPSSRVLADRIVIKPNAQVYDIYFNDLKEQGTVLGDRYSPLELPLFTSYPAEPDVSASSKDISLKSGENIILHSDEYGTLSTKQAARVVLSGGLYSFENWDLGPETEIVCNSPTIIVITGRLKAGPGLALGPSLEFEDLRSQDVQVFVNGFNSRKDQNSGQLAADFGPRLILRANLLVRNGSISIGTESSVVGALIGRWIMLGPNGNVALASSWN